MANACPHRLSLLLLLLLFLLSLLLLRFGNFWVFVGVRCVFTLLPKESNNYSYKIYVFYVSRTKNAKKV